MSIRCVKITLKEARCMRLIKLLNVLLTSTPVHSHLLALGDQVCNHDAD